MQSGSTPYSMGTYKEGVNTLDTMQNTEYH